MSDFERDFMPTPQPPEPRLTRPVVFRLLAALLVMCIVLGGLLYLINEAGI